MARAYASGPTGLPKPYVSPPPLGPGSVSEHEGKANPHPQYATPRSYSLSVTTDGQTIFSLPVVVVDATKVGVYLNTTRQRYGVDWTAAGAVLTWLSTDLLLTITDTLEILI